MAMSDTWVVPGAPLEQGRGWRVWYSQPGTDDFRPAEPTVFLRTTKEEIECDCELFKATHGLDRRMAVQTIRLTNPTPGATYTVHVPGQPAPFTWRSLPSSLSEGISFLMSSCFWRNDDKEGRYGAGVAGLTKMFSPAFQLLLGDQLYQDWPIRVTLRKDPYEIYSDRYIEYWSDDVYRQLLATTPNFFACDDHEFWNNYPEVQPQVFWTIGEKRRPAHKEAARELLHRFQHGANPDGRAYYPFNVGEVAFFVADARSERTPFSANPHYFFTDEQWAELEGVGRGLEGPGRARAAAAAVEARGGSKTDRTLATSRSRTARPGGSSSGARRRHADGTARHPDPDRRHPHRPRSSSAEIVGGARPRSRVRRLARLARQARSCRRGATSRRSCPDKLTINTRELADDRRDGG